MDKKRIVINKPSEKTCDICNEKFSLYSFSGHIKWNHNLTSDEYVSKFGEFRQPKRKPTTRNIKQLTCQLCNTQFPSVGMFTHLRDTHNITVDDYTKQFGEYRPSKLRQIEYKNRLDTIDDTEKQKCVICNEEFASGILLGYHIKNVHKLEKKDYIINHFFKGIRPLCECGCQRKVKLLNYYPYKVNYVNGHNSTREGNAMFGKHHTINTKRKMSIKAIERINRGDGKTIDTIPELRFKAILDKFNIEYFHPCSVDLENRIASVDFYIPEKDIFVEIDGEYWHPENIEGLNFGIISNVISDKQREILENMVRVKSLELDKYERLNTKEELYDVLLDYVNKPKKIGYKQKIINKEYFELCIKEKGRPYLKSNIWLLLKFIRIFQPTLPYPDLEENLLDVIDKISKYDLTKKYDSTTKEFSSNVSTIGHNYLKHYFHSYWKSNFNGNKYPESAWLDDKTMKEVIEYRIGCNDSDEIFDFSLHQLVRGLSARRITISFFKPLLAASIYKKFIGDKINPIVLDPCCGFGGRLLGFKSKYPNGKYIGCEPNIETYNELLTLIKNANWNDVEIYNCKFEDYVDKYNNYDLIFTSIPYYDAEVYSNTVKYDSFDNWKNTFIKSIEKYFNKNCYINAPEELCNKLNWNDVDSYILLNRSHFDKRVGIKKELIVKI